MTALPNNFRELPAKAKHEALRDLACAKADAAVEGSPSQDRWDEIVHIEDSYIQAIERQEARVAR
jgi:hypothetical protein